MNGLVSIIIRNMEMPTDCRECPLQYYVSCCGQTWCRACDAKLADDFKTILLEGRPEWCPLVEIKTPHGDLIDRQKLLEDNKHLEYPTDGKYRADRAWAVGFNAGARHCNEHAVYAKAVIEAEG